jgi:hypothetical protein
LKLKYKTQPTIGLTRPREAPRYLLPVPGAVRLAVTLSLWENSTHCNFDFISIHRSGPTRLNNILRFLSGLSTDFYAASLTVGSITV